MTEKQNINGRDVWLKVDAYPVERDNPNIIPTEYFTATYSFNENFGDEADNIMKDDEGQTRLFESPVAALSFARKRLEGLVK